MDKFFEENIFCIFALVMCYTWFLIIKKQSNYIIFYSHPYVDKIITGEIVEKKKVNLHLISDSSGQTVIYASRSAMAQFKDVEVKEYVWPMVRSQASLERVVNSIKQHPGIILYTFADKNLRDVLKTNCRKLKLPCIAILGKVIKEMSSYLGVGAEAVIGGQHIMGDDYFDKVDAIEFTLRHDDGLGFSGIDDADIILVGASRTSKSPTCVYLAYNGYKAANVPYVHGLELPPILFEVKKPLIVGLTINPNRLVEIRQNRFLSLQQRGNNDYIDREKIITECREAKKIFIENGWPCIDVTRRSIEETSASIIKLYSEKKQRELEDLWKEK